MGAGPIRWFHRTATPMRLALATLVSTLIRYAVMPRLGAEVMNSPGAGPLDLKFAYSPAEAFATIDAFTDQGRAAYRLFLLSADIAYPISYTLMFGWAIVLLARGTRLAPVSWPLIPPLLLLGFDLLENTSIVALLSAYPAKSMALAIAASVFTTLKWIMVGVTIAVLLGLVIMQLAARGASAKP